MSVAQSFLIDELRTERLLLALRGPREGTPIEAIAERMGDTAEATAQTLNTAIELGLVHSFFPRASSPLYFTTRVGTLARARAERRAALAQEVAGG